MKKNLFVIAAISFAAASLLAGCTGTAPKKTPETQLRADYKVFTDATWLPESNIRAPYGATELALPITKVLEKGVYAFDETVESRVEMKPIDATTYIFRETIEETAERALSWGTGASTLYRNGRPVTEWGKTTAQLLPDGRLLISVRGKIDVNFAARVLSYNVSGKPVRQIVRDTNNQPDTYAWYMKPNRIFPTGSVAYIFTYWLGDDEVILPAEGTFTGASSLEKLLENFSKEQPFCLSYIDHTKANPYGVLFDKETLPKKGVLKLLHNISRLGMAPEPEGKFFLYNTNHDNLFCQREPTKNRVTGTWKIRKIHGTRVLELNRPVSVPSSDFGIQPINKDSISVGFAEIESISSSGRTQKHVVPVRILKNNKPITDFRVKFNERAATAVRYAIDEAAASVKALEKRN